MENVNSGKSSRSFRKRTYSSSSRTGSNRTYATGNNSSKSFRDNDSTRSNRSSRGRKTPYTAVYRSESFVGPKGYTGSSSDGTRLARNRSDGYRTSRDSSESYSSKATRTVGYGSRRDSSESSRPRSSSTEGYQSGSRSRGGYRRATSISDSYSEASRSTNYPRSTSSYPKSTRSSGNFSTSSRSTESSPKSYSGSRGSSRSRSSSGYASSSRSSSCYSGTGRSYEGLSRSSSSSNRFSDTGRGSRSYSSSRRSTGGYSRAGHSSGGRGRRPSYNFDERMFVKKAVPTENKEEFVPEFLFKDLEVSAVLKKNIVTKGFDAPTPIQNKAIKEVLQGKDFLGIADTGTGKTAAFLIPLIEKVIKDKTSRVLIITPTRELADQINQELFILTRDLKIFSVQCIGGSSINNQIYNLRRGFNFVIGTPGRLKDLHDRRVLNLGTFNTVVLDEVDRMLDMGFVNEIKDLISFLPDNRQSLCFSATVDKKVEEIINELLKDDFVKISVKTGETAENVEQNIVRVEDYLDKLVQLEKLLAKEEFTKVLIFANTKREVERLDKNLYAKGLAITSIHGDKKQSERKRAIEAFKAGKAKILVATDVAARGLDIKDVSHVINYDIPMTYEDYIHRVGRTGRANKTGVALTFVPWKR